MRTGPIVAGAALVVAAIAAALVTCDGEEPGPAPPAAPPPEAVVVRPTPPRAASPMEVPPDVPGADPDAPPRPPADEALTVRVTVEGADDPVAGVQVVVRPLDGNEERRAATGPDGRARIEGVPAGALLVTALRADGRSDLVPAQRRLAMCPGTLEIAWPRAPRLRGLVEAPPGDGLENVVVVYERPADVGGPGERGQIPIRADRTFEEPVSPGRYRVWAEATGPREGAWADVELDDVDPAAGDVVLAVRRAALVTGRTIDATGEHEFAGIEVLPVASDVRPLRSAGPGRAAPLGGKFDSGALDPGIDVDLWLRATAESTREAVGWGVARRVRAPASGLEVRVEPAWTLRVKAVGPDRMRVTGFVRITARPVGAGPGLSEMFSTSGMAIGGGTAELRGLPPLDLEVTIGGPRQRWCTPQPLVVRPGTEAVTVAVVQTVTLSGTVVLPDGRPPPDDVSLVCLGPQERDPTVERIDAGAFRVRCLVPGPVRIAWLRDYEVFGELGEFVAPATDLRLVLPAANAR